MDYMQVFRRKPLSMSLCVVYSIVLLEKACFGYFSGYCGSLPQRLLCGIAAAQRDLNMSKILTSWIEILLRHCAVQVELHGDKVKREVVKGNPQGGSILSPIV